MDHTVNVKVEPVRCGVYKDTPESSLPSIKTEASVIRGHELEAADSLQCSSQPLTNQELSGPKQEVMFVEVKQEPIEEEDCSVEVGPLLSYQVECVLGADSLQDSTQPLAAQELSGPNQEVMFVKVKQEPIEEEEVGSVQSDQGKLSPSHSSPCSSSATHYAGTNLTPADTCKSLQSTTLGRTDEELCKYEQNIVRLQATSQCGSYSREYPLDYDMGDEMYCEKNTLLMPDISKKRVKQFQCNLCEVSFTLKQSLKAHIRTHSGEKPFSCDICYTRFSRNTDLTRHKRLHTGDRPFACDLCEKRFAERRTLARHKKIHTRDKPFVCDLCDARFSHSSILDQHKKTHSGDKRFACDLCDAQFSRNCDLKRHEKTHSVEKPYACDLCDARFSQISGLDKHKIMHSEDRPFACNLCDKRFSRSSCFARHNRIHSGDKPYACDLCDARFSVRGYLVKHKIIHSEDKPFACHLCDKRFSRKFVLDKHIKIHSGDEPFDLSLGKYTPQS